MPHKGVHVAVEAFGGVDPALARLEIWGDPAGMPTYARELEAGASPAVSFAGPVPEAEKADRLSGLDALIVPSLGLESFGIAAREALARGVPVLASRRGALAEAFAEGQGGAFFEPGDVAGLRMWIDRLCADPGILETWAARRPAVATMDAHAEEVEAVYARVMAARGPR
jgi:glycosyltransferase involved in cell wall biosynthesis